MSAQPKKKPETEVSQPQEGGGLGDTITWQQILDCDGSLCEEGPPPDEVRALAQQEVDDGNGESVPSVEELLAAGWDELSTIDSGEDHDGEDHDGEDAQDHADGGHPHGEPPAWGPPDEDFHPGSRGRGHGNGRGRGRQGGAADGEEASYAAFRSGMGGLSASTHDPLAGCCGEEGGLVAAGGMAVCDEEARLMRMGNGKGQTAAGHLAG